MTNNLTNPQGPSSPDLAHGHQRYILERLAKRIVLSQTEPGDERAIQRTHLAQSSPDKARLRVTRVTHDEYGEHTYLGTETSGDHLVHVEPVVGHTGPTSRLMPEVSETDARQMISALRDQPEL